MVQSVGRAEGVKTKESKANHAARKGGPMAAVKVEEDDEDYREAEDDGAEEDDGVGDFRVGDCCVAVRDASDDEPDGDGDRAEVEKQHDDAGVLGGRLQGPYLGAAT